MTLEKYALEYFKKGFTVLPLTGIKGKECLLSWSKYMPGGPKKVTEDLIKKWWKESPDANIGIIPGSNNYLVIDVDAKNDENGFDYSDPDSSLLYYAGKPFTGLYYELYPNGGIELYSKYQDGVLVEDCFEFYENGKIKSYSYISKDRLNSYSCSFN